MSKLGGEKLRGTEILIRLPVIFSSKNSTIKAGLYNPALAIQTSDVLAPGRKSDFSLIPLLLVIKLPVQILNRINNHPRSNGNEQDILGDTHEAVS